MTKKIKPNDKFPGGNVALAIYKETAEAQRYIDQLARNVTRKHPPSCKKGCADCCKLVTLVGIAEGIVLAADLLLEGRWEKLLDDLVVQAKQSDYEGVNTGSYFEKRIPCAFLKDSICTVYSHRPTPCRTHFAISPPEFCSPDAPRDVRKVTIDFRTLEYRMSMHEIEVAELLKIGDPAMGGFYVAPLPIIVLESLKILTRTKRRTAYHKIVEASRGVPTAGEWLARHVESFAMDRDADPLAMSHVTEEDLVQIGKGIDVRHLSRAAPKLEQDLLPGNEADAPRP